MVPIISVKNLKKTFRTHEREEGLWASFKSLFNRKYIYKKAIDNISFEIQPGEIVGFIGPNGAGKSTTIKALCGILYPDEGEVKCLGYTPWENRIKYVQNIGVVFGQKTQLWWDLPAIDTFDLNKHIYNIPEEAYRARLKQMSKLLDVEEIMKTPVRKMSLGERMKCEAICAFLHNPKIVFLDEPTIGMDVIAKQRLRGFIKWVNKKYKTTVILTTHNMDDIEDLCERVMIINCGKLVYDGNLSEIKKKYIHSKFLKVEFEDPPKGLRLPKYCKIVRKQFNTVEVEVDIKNCKLDKVINKLMSYAQISDITISDPPIDEIIEEIYEKEK